MPQDRSLSGCHRFWDLIATARSDPKAEHRLWALAFPSIFRAARAWLAYLQAEERGPPRPLLYHLTADRVAEEMRKLILPLGEQVVLRSPLVWSLNTNDSMTRFLYRVADVAVTRLTSNGDGEWRSAPCPSGSMVCPPPTPALRVPMRIPAAAGFPDFAHSLPAKADGQCSQDLVKVALHWTQAAESTRWYLSVRIPSLQEDRAAGNEPQVLRDLEDRLVHVEMHFAKEQARKTIQVCLRRVENNSLCSDEKEFSERDPRCLSAVRLHIGSRVLRPE